MNRRDKAKLHMLDGLNDEVLQRNSEKRAILWNAMCRRRRKKWISMVSAAACLVLITTVALLFWKLFGLGRQVPVYTGMTVSSEYTPQQQSASYFTDATLPMQFLGNNNGNNGNNGNHGNNGNKQPELPEDSEPMEDVVASTLNVTGGVEDVYYAMPNQDIYITVHIDNPDKFEILSFTLNGEKYSSYMFEEGSDMENLVLKINMGDAEKEILKYTIDAIKYVEGEAIKDVRMEGDQTVEVAVGTEQQPTAEITGETVGFYDVQFQFSITDAMALLEAEGVELYAVLYDGEKLVEQKSFTLGETDTVTFSKLKGGTCYQYGIVAVYDAWDGEGVLSRVLVKKTFETLPEFEIIDAEASPSMRRLQLKWNVEALEKTFALYDGNTLLHSVNLTDDQATEEVTFTNLEPGKEYRLLLTFHNRKEFRTIEKIFAHRAVQLPVLDAKMRVGSWNWRNDWCDDGVRLQECQDLNVYSIISGTVISRNYSIVWHNFDDKVYYICMLKIQDQQGEIVEYNGLMDVKLQEGDSVEVGQFLGKIPTKSTFPISAPKATAHLLSFSMNYIDSTGASYNLFKFFEGFYDVMPDE